MHGWQSFWWISTAISAFTNVWIFCFLPETKWDRREPSTSMTANSPILVGGENSAGKATELCTDQVQDQHDAHTQDQHLLVVAIVPGRPNKKQFLPIAGWQRHEPISKTFLLPFQLIQFPIVIWGALQFTFACSCYLMINLTQSQALAAPPYNFSPAAVGYTNLAPFVGTSFALCTAGPLGDWISHRATIRNKGIREPEMRLPAMVPFVVCFLLGCIVLSVGYQYGWPWEVVVIVGFGLVGVEVAAIAAISVNYVVSQRRAS
jgi:hypothetical protein